MGESGESVVLIVEDEPDVAETYERWLRTKYDVRVAVDGEDALAQLDETVDVVLLDRMMPEMSGGEVLADIRESGLDCRVAMVTAVDPDFDIIEMGFDEYVVKPPERDELIGTIERLLHRATIRNDMQEYYSLVARRSALQTQKSEEELAANEEYTDLADQIEALRETVDSALGDMSSDTDFVGAVREITNGDTESTDEPSVEGNRG